ncbi:MAG: hypothetical protein WBH36_11495, partial [Syntrophobacteria bacterium]
CDNYQPLRYLHLFVFTDLRLKYWLQVIVDAEAWPRAWSMGHGVYKNIETFIFLLPAARCLLLANAGPVLKP